MKTSIITKISGYVRILLNSLNVYILYEIL